MNSDYIRCLQSFDYTDHGPLTGKNFYRVKIKDETGKITYSNTVLLINSKTGFEIVNIQPNPVTNIAQLNISVAAKQDLLVVITDSKGSRVMQMNLHAVSGINQEELDLSSLPSGTYLLSVVSAIGEQKIIRFIKQ